MSLLMLKTKDLTHQDHILNFELMLNPTRSGLLLNKHRSLESKRDKEKEICEVERQFAVNSFHVEKRLIERRRKLLLENAAKRTYYRDTPVADNPRPPLYDGAGLAEEEEDIDEWESMPRTRPPFGSSKSKPGAISRRPAAVSSSKVKVRPDTSGSRRQVTSCKLEQRPQTTGCARQGRQTLSSSPAHNEPHKRGVIQDRRPIPSSRRSTAFVSQATQSIKYATPLGYPGNARAREPTTKEDPNIVAKGHQTFITDLKHSADEPSHQEGQQQQQHSNESLKNRTLVTALQTEEQNKTALNNRVGQFLNRVEDFKTRPQSHDADAREANPWMVHNRPKKSSATVAKRYNQLSLDIEKLYSAFDKLCVERNPDELQKIVKLASKLKANVKYARNVSFVPVMATLKGGKRFRENAISSH